jgi:predicted dehydrogenase
MMKREVRIALVGLGGYGETYLAHLLDHPADDAIRIVGGVDPAPDRCGRVKELRERGIPLFASLDDFYVGGGEADLVIICSPIQCHRPQTEMALAHGASVLCEKPLCATIQDASAMAAAEEAAEGFVAIGYQWSYSAAIQTLKADVMSGALGRPLEAKTLVCWPRSSSYYGRNRWAGALKSDDGEWVLDSPVNNATAHYLHNMLYVLGETRETSALPLEVTAELYRANRISNYDTGMLRVRVAGGLQMVYVASHAVPTLMGPLTHIRFEEADVYAGPQWDDQFCARFKDGRVKHYGTPEDGVARKIWDCVDAARSGDSPACGIAAALSQTLCMNGAQESAGQVVEVPPEVVETVGNEDPVTTIRGLLPLAVQCYEHALLPSELGCIPWARAGRPINLADYTMFPSHIG